MDTWIPCVYFLRLFLSDQGIPVEYELDKFNTPHKGTTLIHDQNWLCRWRCLIPFRHVALTSPLGNNNGDTHASPQIHQTHKTHGDSKVYFLLRQTRLPLNYGEHNPYDTRCFLNSIISPFRLFTHNFFHKACSTNTNSIFHAANKNYS